MPPAINTFGTYQSPGWRWSMEQLVSKHEEHSIFSLATLRFCNINCGCCLSWLREWCDHCRLVRTYVWYLRTDIRDDAFTSKRINMNPSTSNKFSILFFTLQFGVVNVEQRSELRRAGWGGRTREIVRSVDDEESARGSSSALKTRKSALCLVSSH